MDSHAPPGAAPDTATRRFARHHDHTFGQDRKREGESRTIVVIALTFVTMIVEVTAGLLYGSMALLADGLHMASHAAALTITAAAYVYARRHASDARYSFGTGKVNALSGFAGALLLGLFAGGMVYESVERIIAPVPIVFDHALFVAVIGLVVNAASVFLLGHGDRSHHDHHAEDHNLRSAYLHVLADALTSVAAIVALLAAKYAGLVWMDPAVGVAGAVLVGRWSLGLIRQTTGVLLDRQAPESIIEPIRRSIGADADVLDLHVWCIGPGIYACILSLADDSEREPEEFLERLPDDVGLAHATVEIRRRV